MDPGLFIYNVNILSPEELFENSAISIRGNKIVSLGPFAALPKNMEILDGRGGWLVPGFIDLQVNGGFGWDFTADPSSIWEVATRLPRHGVTAFLPTIISSPPETVKRAQAVLAFENPGERGAAPLGLHVEGPFINREKTGAHNPAHLALPKDRGWSRKKGVWLVTLAPELKGAQRLIKKLAFRDVLVSAGHSKAESWEGIAGFDAGIRYATHLFNAMPPLDHRKPGLVGSILDDDRVTAGLIADGVHVDPAVIRMVWKVLGPERLNLVTDAMAALGMPPGMYALGEAVVFVTETDARLPDSTLAGSILSMDEALRNFIDFTGASLQDAVKTITSTPAGLLGLSPKKGRIEPGADADLVLLSPELRVQQTIIEGETAFMEGLHE